MKIKQKIYVPGIPESLDLSHLPTNYGKYFSFVLSQLHKRLIDGMNNIERSKSIFFV